MAARQPILLPSGMVDEVDAYNALQQIITQQRSEISRLHMVIHNRPEEHEHQMREKAQQIEHLRNELGRANERLAQIPSRPLANHSEDLVQDPNYPIGTVVQELERELQKAREGTTPDARTADCLSAARDLVVEQAARVHAVVGMASKHESTIAEQKGLLAGKNEEIAQLKRGSRHEKVKLEVRKIMAAEQRRVLAMADDP